MDRYISYKFKLMSLICMILVLYIHSGFRQDEIQGMTSVISVQIVISGMIGQLAVPVFFIMSGYLFSRNIMALKDVLQKMKRRFYSLFIPFVIASMAFLIIYLILDLVPSVNKFVSSPIDFKTLFFNPFNFIYCFFLDAGGGNPLCFQLWFLRDLIIIVIISPLLYIASSKIGGAIITLLLFAIYCYLQTTHHAFVLSLFWFMLGYSCFKQVEKLKSPYWLVLYVALYIVKLSFEDLLSEFGQPTLRLVGVLGLWSVYDKLVGKSFELSKHKILSYFVAFNFFIYLYHEPSINFFRKIIVIVIGKNELGYLMSYLLSPLLFTLLAVILGTILKKYTPRLYSIMVGGR